MELPGSIRQAVARARPWMPMGDLKLPASSCGALEKLLRSTGMADPFSALERLRFIRAGDGSYTAFAQSHDIPPVTGIPEDDAMELVRAFADIDVPDREMLRKRCIGEAESRGVALLESSRDDRPSKELVIAAKLLCFLDAQRKAFVRARSGYLIAIGCHPELEAEIELPPNRGARLVQWLDDRSKEGSLPLEVQDAWNYLSDPLQGAHLGPDDRSMLWDGLAVFRRLSCQFSRDQVAKALAADVALAETQPPPGYQAWKPRAREALERVRDYSHSLISAQDIADRICRVDFLDIRKELAKAFLVRGQRAEGLHTAARRFSVAIESVLDHVESGEREPGRSPYTQHFYSRVLSPGSWSWIERWLLRKRAGLSEEQLLPASEFRSSVTTIIRSERLCRALLARVPEAMRVDLDNDEKNRETPIDTTGLTESCIPIEDIKDSLGLPLPHISKVAEERLKDPEFLAAAERMTFLMENGLVSQLDIELWRRLAEQAHKYTSIDKIRGTLRWIQDSPLFVSMPYEEELSFSFVLKEALPQLMQAVRIRSQLKNWEKALIKKLRSLIGNDADEFQLVSDFKRTLQTFRGVGKDRPIFVPPVSVDLITQRMAFREPLRSDSFACDFDALSGAREKAFGVHYFLPEPIVDWVQKCIKEYRKAANLELDWFEKVEKLISAYDAGTLRTAHIEPPDPEVISRLRKISPTQSAFLHTSVVDAVNVLYNQLAMDRRLIA